jgi:hypothetical protein
MNTKQLCFLLLSIVSLQHISLSACCCLDQNNPLAQQVFLSDAFGIDFKRLCGEDSSTGLRPANPNGHIEEGNSDIEIYDTKTNATLITLPAKEVIKIYGIICNADKTILLIFMADASKANNLFASTILSAIMADEINNPCACCTAQVWDIKNKTCLFTIPQPWAGNFNHKGDKIITFNLNKTQAWDIKTKNAF